MNPSPWTVERRPLDDAEKQRMEEAWRAWAGGDRGKAGPLQSALTVWGFYGLLGAGLSAMSLLDGKPYMTWLLVLMIIGGGGVAGIVYFKARGGDRALEETVQGLQEVTDAEVHELRFTAPHAWVPHEHGILLFLDLGDGTTYFRDISTVADDPWEEAVLPKVCKDGLTEVMRWRRLEVAGREYDVDFAFVGPPVEARIFEVDEASKEFEAFWDDVSVRVGEGSSEKVEVPFKAIEEALQRLSGGGSPAEGRGSAA